MSRRVRNAILDLGADQQAHHRAAGILNARQHCLWLTQAQLLIMTTKSIPLWGLQVTGRKRLPLSRSQRTWVLRLVVDLVSFILLAKKAADDLSKPAMRSIRLLYFSTSLLGS